MKLRTSLVAWCVLLVAGSTSAQSQAVATDPISGTWTGYMGPNEADQHAITAALKFDGKTVTGTITGPPYRGDIRSGTFDRATGALKLEIVVQDEDKTLVFFEGTLADGTAAGRVRFDKHPEKPTGTFKISKKTESENPPERSPSVASAPANAQSKLSREQMKASYDTHKGDFDYLLGDWEFTAESKEYGKMHGYWSAVRLDEGQILDEYRVVGDKGETYYVTTSLRNYNSALGCWELVGADAGSGLQDMGTGQKVGAEMHIEQKFGVMSDKPSVWRIRYYNIQPDKFSWAADRSLDGGNTWEKNHQQIEARRIGPARSLGALAPARK